MRRWKKLLVVVVLFALVAGGAFLLLYVKQSAWVASPPYRRATTSPPRVLVVAYSRTGNTLVAAKEAARFFDARLVEIAAPQYGLTWAGQLRASDDADRQIETTPIEHESVDLSPYDLIVLCSPTWWFRPAVPVWSFVESHDFLGKPVVLLMTGNSRYKPALVAKFRERVEAHHGVFLDALFVRRGRFYWQKSSAEVRGEVRAALAARKDLWPTAAKER